MLIAKPFLDDRSGATALEYAMIAAGIGLAVAVVTVALGESVSSALLAIAGAIGAV